MSYTKQNLENSIYHIEAETLNGKSRYEEDIIASHHVEALIDFYTLVKKETGLVPIRDYRIDVIISRKRSE